MLFDNKKTVPNCIDTVIIILEENARNNTIPTLLRKNATTLLLSIYPFLHILYQR